MSRKPVGLSLVSMMMLSMLASPVVGEWESDSWLSNVIGPERLALGDEFGCHGYEGLDIVEEPWTIAACRDYLSGLTEASRWGATPISFGLNGIDLDEGTNAALLDAKFEIVGDGPPGYSDGLAYFESNGGTLEKSVANRSLLESPEQHSLISIEWMARMHDLKVREDGELISWLEQQEVWLTTWGEWHHHRISGSKIVTSNNGSTVIASLEPSTSWNVPGTLELHFDERVMEVVHSNGSDFPVIDSGERHLRVGWREIMGGVVLTLEPGTSVIIELDGGAPSIQSMPQATFNGLNHAVTIVGHHTTNLFHWSSDFQNSDLRFTWLIERPSTEDVGWLLPVLAASTLLAVPITVRHLVNRDEIPTITPMSE